MPTRGSISLGTISVALLAVSGCVSAGRTSYAAMERDYGELDAQLKGAHAQDERMFGAPQLERSALVKAVLDRNPSIESARQAWRAALARYRQAGAYEDPTIELSVAPLSIASPNARFGYEVGISQRIPLGDKLDAQAALAAAEAEVVSGDFKAARLQLALTASQLYDDYCAAVRSLEIQAQHLELVAALKQSAIAAYESGRAALQDSLAAESELARLEYQNTVLETERDVAVAQLDALLHRTADAPLPPPATEPELRDAQDSETPAALEQAIERRPDIAAARARVHVAQARSTAAQSDYYPDLTLSTSYNSMWDMAEHRWMAGVGFSVPLARARRAAALDEASAASAASESAVRSMSDAARGQLAVITRRLEQARRAVQLYEQRLVPIAREQIEAARSGFVAAQNSFYAVIEAERNLRSAELEMQTARADLSKRRAEFDHARGRLPGLPEGEAAP